MAGKPKKGGRITPKKAVPESGSTAKSSRSGAGNGGGGDAAIPQVGRRPSSPTFLFTVAGLWLAAGALIWYFWTASWKLIPAIFAIGVGLFFLRGALQTVVRHDERLGEPDD